jgi:hypothetical protein
MHYTVEDRKDGFGAQFQTRICSILIYETPENQYVHTPIESMEHNYENDPSFISNANNFMNLMNYNKIITDKDITIFSITHIVDTFDSNINQYLSNSETLKKIKCCFWENKNKNFFNNDKINVAVHIRCLNKVDTPGNEYRYTNLKYYFNIIDIIKEKYKDKELLFHIYSQNDINDYDEFDKTNIIFHLNENIFDTFIGLVTAEILITSKSSFSYTAAILSDGEIYYQPFWHKPSEKWIICNSY